MYFFDLPVVPFLLNDVDNKPRVTEFHYPYVYVGYVQFFGFFL